MIVPGDRCCGEPPAPDMLNLRQAVISRDLLEHDGSGPRSDWLDVSGTPM